MKIFGVQVSKKLSVLIGTVAVWYLQQKGIAVGEVVNQAIVTPLDSLVAQANDPNDDIIAYLGGGYIAIQGLVDAVSKWRNNQNAHIKNTES